MKGIIPPIFIVCLFLFFCNSCDKYPIDDKNTELPMDITGVWEWIFTYRIYPLSDSNPLTPKYTGIQEILEYRVNKTWLKTQNDIHVDSGTYSIGHGTYIPYIGSYIYIYDSIVYYRNGAFVKGSQEYYKIYNDTLQFSPGFGGICGGESKFYIKQH